MSVMRMLLDIRVHIDGYHEKYNIGGVKARFIRLDVFLLLCGTVHPIIHLLKEKLGAKNKLDNSSIATQLFISYYQTI